MKQRKVGDSFHYAFSGLFYVLKSQPHMRFHFIAAIGVLLSTLILKLNTLEMLYLFMTISLVLVAEMFNTCIEALMDVLAEHPNPHAKIAKDVAAGGVLVASINAVIVAASVLLPKIVAAVRVFGVKQLMFRRCGWVLA